MARVVVVAGHPDDETLFGGGYLARHALAGDEVWVVCVTRGEGGEVGEPPVAPKALLGEAREHEVRAAVQALGGRGVDFLGYVDPYAEIGGILSPIAVPFEEFASAIADQLGALRAEVVVSHGSNGEYGHPQHIYTHRAVRAAIGRLPADAAPRLVTWCACAPETEGDRLTNKDDPADEVLHLEGTPELERKIAATYCYGSQHAMILRNSKRPSVRDAVRRIEAYRHWPNPQPELPPEPSSA
jgi:LmbE family N-acetylglucosaminyl deacetylase